MGAAGFVCDLSVLFPTRPSAAVAVGLMAHPTTFALVPTFCHACPTKLPGPGAPQRPFSQTYLLLHVTLGLAQAITFTRPLFPKARAVAALRKVRSSPDGDAILMVLESVHVDLRQDRVLPVLLLADADNVRLREPPSVGPSVRPSASTPSRGHANHRDFPSYQKPWRL
jgi:hypothetical protein